MRRPLVDMIRRLLWAAFLPSLLGIAVVTIDSWIPRDSIVAGIQREFADGRFDEGNYSFSTDQLKVDTFTECGIASLNLDLKKSFLERMQLNSYGGNCSKLREKIEDQSIFSTSIDYYRYWFGTMIVVHFGLSTIGMANLSVVLFICLLYSAAKLAIHSVGQNDFLVASFVGVIALVLRFDTVMQSIPHAVIWTSTLAIPLLACRFMSLAFCSQKRHSGAEEVQISPTFKIFVVTVFCGGVMNLFDLLVAISLLPAVGALVGARCFQSLSVNSSLVSNEEDGRYFSKNSLSVLIASQAGIVSGYIFTWSVRWTVAGSNLGFRDAIEGVIIQGARRTSGETGEFSIFTATRAVISSLLEVPGGVALIILSAFVIAQMCWFAKALWPAVAGSVSLVGTLSILEVFQDHTSRHSWFLFPVLILSALLGAMSYLLFRSSGRSVSAMADSSG